MRALYRARAGSSMRRSRALSLFGCFLTMLAVATVTAGSRAADRNRLHGPASSVSQSGLQRSLRLLPEPWRTDAPVLGSFAKPAPGVDGPPVATACPSG